MISLSLHKHNFSKISNKYCENKSTVSILQSNIATVIKVTKYSSLANSVKQILRVPATSAPVERVFSHGGIIVHPHQSSFTPQRLYKNLFLKCSEHVFVSELL